MTKSRWFTHPLFVFIFSLIALGSSLAIYITTYLKVNNAFLNFVNEHNFDSKLLLENAAWPNILILSILVALIITGMAFIFVYYQKVIQLYRMQQNFINGFTHELKTPVTSLALFLDTFSQHELPRAEQLKYLKYMRRDTNRLSDNISQILNLAKFEERKYKLDYSKIELKEFVTEILEKNSHLFVKIRIDVTAPHSYFFQGDRHLIEVLIMNVLTNATTYNESDNKEITIKLKENRNNIELNFTDNGIGLDKKHIKKIFKKFYRAKKAVKGSGIGLYTAKHIVKLHNGTILVQSSGPGQGSTFIIKLAKDRHE